ncbi:aminotransferase class IV [Tumebacillus permanentifrigoris]|uniref:Branched-chain amino acid aminotransferase/4-amino-4-deoxychorismate lyase n=1 Tax=Tumebacillus permanentifrigoris TaxID=378543 RepID=A0A316DSE5_9BACL|nr:aminotransferase class IV [Tumebacillus permanentifrigoris]PWK08465.1 branched-chain amino acid aminotransferase/4-amino-4-deoxychorismate lyase [Tumebacillus permanentifrigoris]
MYVCLNGKILPVEQAQVSVLDHGFLYGAGLFETMRTVGGEPMFWAEHYARLVESAEALQLVSQVGISVADDSLSQAGLPLPQANATRLDTPISADSKRFPWSSSDLHDLITATVRANDLEEAYVRLSLTRGPGALGPSGKTCQTPTLVIYAKPLALPAEDVYRCGRDLLILQTRRNSPELPVRVKSLNYLNSLLAYAELEARGGGEGIQLTNEGWIAEGAVSNLFFVVEGELWTPSLDTGILPGITRAWVLQTARQQGIPTREHRFTRAELREMTEAFTTSSVVGILPVVSVEQTPIDAGVPGPITSYLMQKWRTLTSRNN